MKKYLLILLTIALIFLVEIKAENPSGENDSSGDNDDKNNTTKPEQDKQTEGDQKPGTSKEYNETFGNGADAEILTKGNINEPEPKGTKMHLSVLEGFRTGYHFNFFGKKFKQRVYFVFVMIIYNTRLRNRLRLRNLAPEDAGCDTYEEDLINAIIAADTSLSREKAKEKLENSYESMLKCNGTSSASSLGIDWSKSPEGANPEPALKQDNDIGDNTGSNYLESIAEGIAKGYKYMHIIGAKPTTQVYAKEFTITSYYANAIIGGESVIKDRDTEIPGVDFEGNNCDIKGVGNGKTITCKNPIKLSDNNIKLKAFHPNANDEEIFLNLVGKNDQSLPVGSSTAGDTRYPDKSGSGLSTGGIVAIVIVCVVIVVAIAAISFLLSKKPNIPQENDITNEIDSQARAAPVQ